MNTSPLQFRASLSSACDTSRRAGSHAEVAWPDTRPPCLRSEAFAEDLQELCSRTGRAQPVVGPDRGSRSLLRVGAVVALTALALAGTVLGLIGTSVRLFGA